MSSTTRTNEEIESAADFYPTPLELCHATVAQLKAHKLIDVDFGPALEPSVGTGNWLNALRAHGYGKEIVAVEKNEEYLPPEALIADGCRLIVGDFLDQTKATLLGADEDFEDGGFGLIIGNPPFSLAGKFIRHALTLLRPDGVLAVVMRVGWFSQELERDKTPRRDWLWGRLMGLPDADVRAQPERLYLVMPRPRFGGKGTDSATYVVGVWTRQFDEQEAKNQKPVPTKLYPLVWRERRKNAIEKRRETQASAPIDEENPDLPECPDTLRDPDADKPIPYVPTDLADTVAQPGTDTEISNAEWDATELAEEKG